MSHTDQSAGTGTDPQAAARVAVALAALTEVTDAGDVGALIDATEVEPGLVDLHFAATMAGYPGWRWTVSTALVADAAPTVLELALLPGDGALLAPPWVPWTERLAEWRRSHPEGIDGAEGGGDDADEDLDDPDDLDADDDLPDEELLDDDLLDDAVEDDDEDEDDGDGDGERDEDVRGPRPGEVDRSL